MNYYQSIIFIGISVLTLFFQSCNSTNTFIEESGKPQIDYIINNPTYVGDTITIFGNNFGDRSLESFVKFNDSTIIHYSTCLKWTISQIKFVVPNISADSINVIVKSDTSNKLKIIINRLPELKTVEVPAGNFVMGSEFGAMDEQPVHQVQISRNLIVSQFEINQFYYFQVTGQNPSIRKDNRLPVDSITWIDAVNFCNQLSLLQGLTPSYIISGDKAKWDTTSNGWRLPTEAEWEYLCRAGETYDYSGSPDLNNDGWYNLNSGLHSYPSGLKLPNAFKLYDMHGNVWEWCWDFYDSKYYSQSPLVNPTGPSSGTRHVARGGSYGDGNSLARASNRYFPDDGTIRTGIRIVRNK